MKKTHPLINDHREGNSWLRTVFFGKRVRAGVLQLTLGIGIVISVLCASMILLVYYSQTVFLHQNIDDKLRNNASSGVQYGMAMRSELPFGVLHTIDLFGEEIDTVHIRRKPWGIFEIVLSTAKQNNHAASTAALITALPDKHGKASVYAPENNAPIYLVGIASLTGEAYLPERKLATGYINGIDYEGGKLPTADIHKSEIAILPLDTLLLQEVENIMNHKDHGYDLRPLDGLPGDLDVSHQSNGGNYYFTTSQLRIGESLKGNLIVHSSERLRVGAESHLSDVILIARDIDIEDGFKGSVQCFASRTITVGRDCILEYPSALVLMNEMDSLILIRDNAKVNGYVIIPGTDQSIAGRGIFKLEKKGILHGMAYINGAADIQGQLWGHITAKQFIASSGTGRYSNHILNGRISVINRSRHLPATLLWANAKELTVAKWLR